MLDEKIERVSIQNSICFISWVCVCFFLWHNADRQEALHDETNLRSAPNKERTRKIPTQRTTRELSDSTVRRSHKDLRCVFQGRDCDDISES